MVPSLTWTLPAPLKSADFQPSRVLPSKIFFQAAVSLAGALSSLAPARVTGDSAIARTRTRNAGRECSDIVESSSGTRVGSEGRCDGVRLSRAPPPLVILRKGPFDTSPGRKRQDCVER